MSNLSINLNIDRMSSGNARVHGKVGDNFQDVTVRKGPQTGDAYVEGEQNGRPTTLRINSAFSDHGQKVFGRLAGVEFTGNWEQEATEGDVALSLNEATLSLDQDPAGKVTESSGTRIRSTSKITNEERDETLALLADGRRIDLSVDRQCDGDIEVRGKNGGENFRFSMDRRGKDGSMRITGTIPESLSLLPVMWEAPCPHPTDHVSPLAVKLLPHGLILMQ